jgi:hypothetical protein
MIPLNLKIIVNSRYYNYKTWQIRCLCRKTTTLSFHRSLIRCSVDKITHVKYGLELWPAVKDIDGVLSFFLKFHYAKISLRSLIILEMNVFITFYGSAA